MKEEAKAKPGSGHSQLPAGGLEGSLRALVVGPGRWLLRAPRFGSANSSSSPASSRAAPSLTAQPCPGAPPGAHTGMERVLELLHKSKAHQPLRVYAGPCVLQTRAVQGCQECSQTQSHTSHPPALGVTALCSAGKHPQSVVEITMLGRTPSLKLRRHRASCFSGWGPGQSVRLPCAVKFTPP